MRLVLYMATDHSVF